MKKWVAYLSEAIYGPVMGLGLGVAFGMWGIILAVVLAVMHVMATCIMVDIDISEALKDSTNGTRL